MSFIEYTIDFIELKNKNIIGIDEVGVGDYFGPLCSAAVYVPYENIKELEKIGGIGDSKKLSDTKILSLAKKIKESNLVKYSIFHLTPNGYNSLNKNYNANYLKMFTHLKAFSKLSEIKVDYIFIDQYSTKNSILKYYNDFVFKNNWANLKEFNSDVLLANKAESLHISVAIASILARADFLEFMKNMNIKYNVQFPFGAGNNVKEFAEEFFNSVGNDENIKIHTSKQSFDMKKK